MANRVGSQAQSLMAATVLPALLGALVGLAPLAGIDFDLVSSAAAAESGGHTDKGSDKGGKSGGAGHSTGGDSGAGHSSSGSSGHSGGGGSSGHSSGGASGGHSGGGAPGGHSGGGGSGGHTDGGSGHKGGEKAMHGMRPDHAGHASGQHQSTEHKGRKAGRQSTAHNDHEFSGGSGLSGSEQVPEGLAADTLALSSVELAAVEGSSATEARERHSFGPGPQFQRRLRYWGGRSVDDGDDDDDDGGGGDDGDDGTTPPPGPGGGGPSTALLIEAGGRCDDHVAAKLNGWDRFAGSNMGRIDTIIGRYVAQAKGGAYMSAAFLVGNYQQELEKKNPDAVLAGTYLGLIAGNRAVTAELVKDVNFGLCVVVDNDEAREIAAAAEIQRLAAK